MDFKRGDMVFWDRCDYDEYHFRGERFKRNGFQLQRKVGMVKEIDSNCGMAVILCFEDRAELDVYLECLRPMNEWEKE